MKSEASSSKPFELDEIDRACKEIEEEATKNKRKNKEKISESNKDELKQKLTMTVSKDKKQTVEKQTVEKPTEKEFAGDKMKSEEKSQSWIAETVNVVIEHLNKFGACVIDDFLGERKGVRILDEVLDLRKREIFQEGQLASVKAEKSIRSDKITWTDGASPPTPNIKNLINMIDTIVMTANKAPNNGVLSNYNIGSRTKAMIACYPGEGTHYVKHIDNPNKDGRCITAIYYLNRNWEPEKDGGSLKIYSACVEGVIAQVDPFFDRVIFFWSDRRNPHEVLPAYRERYAITVWYMDEKEKSDFDEKKRLKVASTSSSSVTQRSAI